MSNGACSGAGSAADESRPVSGAVVWFKDSSANRGSGEAEGAILVRFVAVPVSDRRGSGTYHNSYHNPGFGLSRSPVNC